MLFVSTPSLTISLVLAVFYLANLAFYAVNRQQDADSAAEIISIGPKKELQHTIFLYGEDNTLKHKAHNDTWLGTTCVLDFFATIIEQNSFRHSLPDPSPFIFDPGIGWKPFCRPPPAKLNN